MVTATESVFEQLDLLKREIEKIQESQVNNQEFQNEIQGKIIEFSIRIENLREEMRQTSRLIEQIRTTFESKFSDMEGFKNKIVGIAISLPILISILLFLISKIS